MYILETNSFKYYLGERLLFKLPALKLHTKSRIGLIGLNGSGKTTLLELLAGIRPIPAAAKIICKTTMTILPQLKERLSKSGGETTQAYILQALKQQSGLLLADEPTNNLDMDHLLWLEKELRHNSGALILVSHDRDFLDALCNEIWALEDKQLQIYQGNYSNYQQQKIISEKTHDQAYRKYIMQKTHLETAFSAKQQQAQKAVKTTKISLSEARITGAKPYFAKKQKKLQQTGQSLLTRLDKLKQIENPDSHGQRKYVDKRFALAAVPQHDGENNDYRRDKSDINGQRHIHTEQRNQENTGFLLGPVKLNDLFFLKHQALYQQDRGADQNAHQADARNDPGAGSAGVKHGETHPAWHRKQHENAENPHNNAGPEIRFYLKLHNLLHPFCGFTAVRSEARTRRVPSHSPRPGTPARHLCRARSC